MKLEAIQALKRCKSWCQETEKDQASQMPGKKTTRYEIKEDPRFNPGCYYWFTSMLCVVEMKNKNIVYIMFHYEIWRKPVGVSELLFYCSQNNKTLPVSFLYAGCRVTYRVMNIV